MTNATTKTIELHGMTIELIKHASESPSAGRHRHEAGVDAGGTVYYKGSTGRWSIAHQTRDAANRLLG